MIIERHLLMTYSLNFDIISALVISISLDIAFETRVKLMQLTRICIMYCVCSRYVLRAVVHYLIRYLPANVNISIFIYFRFEGNGNFNLSTQLSNMHIWHRMKIMAYQWAIANLQSKWIHFKQNLEFAKSVIFFIVFDVSISL